MEAGAQFEKRPFSYCKTTSPVEARWLFENDGFYHIKVVNKYTVDFILKLMMQGKPTILSEDPELVAAVSNSSLFVLLVASADPTTGAFLTQKSSF